MDLHSDCSRCFALCCVLLPYSANAGFGADKPGGTACTNLDAEDRCQIHTDLRDTGWRGCTIFECFGAGQQVSQVTYRGRSWRDPSVNRGEMAAVLSAMRLIHEMVFHLEDALERVEHAGALALRERLVALAEGSPEDVLLADLDDLLEEAGEILGEVSAAVRGDAPSFRSDLLMARDFRGVDLGEADFLGADLRDARLEGADLSRVLFMTQPQLNAAIGDGATRIPPRLSRPASWGSTVGGVN